MNAINTMQKPNLQGVHVNWTAPAHENKYATSRNFLSPDNYEIDDYEILSTILSIASWQKWYGPIHLYCDEIAADYYERIGILSLWDHVDTDLITTMDQDINPITYFAAAKLWVQKHLPIPYCIIDTDAYFTEPDYHFLAYDSCASHHEILTTLAGEVFIYPPVEQLQLSQTFQFRADYSFKSYPLNVAFLYINNCKLRDYYTAEALEFIKAHPKQPQSISRIQPYIYMVFAEQRLLAEIIAHHQFNNTVLEKKIWSTEPDHVWLNPDSLKPATHCQHGTHHTAIKIGSSFEHLWLAKDSFKKDSNLRKQAVARLLDKLKALAPALLQLDIVQSIKEQSIVT